MNTTDTTLTAATPEVNAPDAAAAAATATTAPATTALDTPALDTLELIRRESDPAPAPDPSDTFLAHPRASIWDIA